jgi:predicted AAA+ superfamily ATPase
MRFRGDARPHIGHHVVDLQPIRRYDVAMIARNLQAALHDALTDTPVVLLHGARQTGKTTLAQMLLQGGYSARYLTLDQTAVLAAATADPEGFVAGLGGPAVIDEVQRAPGLLTAIKARVDLDRRPGAFLLTGSASVLTLPRVADALVGRMQVITLWPLSQGEIEGRRESFLESVFDGGFGSGPPTTETRDAVVERVVRGGFPEAVSRSSASRREAWFDSYLSTIIQRDVRELGDLARLTEVPHLLRLLAARAASLVNMAEISRSAAMPQSTLKRYVALLHSLFLVSLLPAWSTNFSKRLVKAPKLLITDTGLASFLLGLDAARLREDPRVLGPLLEDFVAMELVKQLGWAAWRGRLFHFRTAEGAEVDIVLERADGRVVGVEVKAGVSLGAADFRGLRMLAEAAGPRFVRGVVLYLGETVVPFSENLCAVPLPALWR